MDMVEKHLAALMAEAAPPPRDAAFALGVMARIEQRRFRRELAINAAIAALAAAVLFGLAPLLGPAAQSINGDMIATLLVVGAALIAMQYSLQQMES